MPQKGQQPTHKKIPTEHDRCSMCECRLSRYRWRYLKHIGFMCYKCWELFLAEQEDDDEDLD